MHILFKLELHEDITDHLKQFPGFIIAQMQSENFKLPNGCFPVSQTKNTYFLQLEDTLAPGSIQSKQRVCFFALMIQ